MGATVIRAISLFVRGRVRNYIPGIYQLMGNDGYTLYLVVVVLAIAGALFSVSLISSTQTHVQAVDYLHETRATLLAQSGLHRASYFYNGGDGHSLFWESPKLEETFPGIGSLHMSSVRFGAFSRLRSAGVCRRRESVIEGLAGRLVPRNMEPTITLTGHSGSIVFTEGTTVGGNLVLHHGSIKDGNKRPIRGMQDNVYTRQSPPMPFDCSPLIAVIKDAEFRQTAALANAQTIMHSIVINSSQDTLLLRDTLLVNGDCTIRNAVVENTHVIATGDMTIANGTVCRDGMFVGKRIKLERADSEYALFFSADPLIIESGNHNSQFFTKDSLIVRGSPHLQNMTVLISWRQIVGDSTYEGGIFLENQDSSNGTFICFDDTTRKIRMYGNPESIVFPAGSFIKGNIITDGAIMLQQSVVQGHIWAKEIHAKDGDKSYTNWLFGCSVSPPVHEPVFPLLGQPPARVAVWETRSSKRQR